MARASIAVKKVTATDLRGKLKTYLKQATANRVVLVENRRQPPKYLVDKDFLDSLVNERESILATLEILADRELTDRLLTLSKTLRLAGCLQQQMFLANEQRAKTAFALRSAARSVALEISLRTQIHVRCRTGHQSSRRQCAQSTPKSLREEARH